MNPLPDSDSTLVPSIDSLQRQLKRQGERLAQEIAARTRAEEALNCLQRDLAQISVQQALAQPSPADRRREAQAAVSRALEEAGTLAEAVGRLLQLVCEHLDWELGEHWEVERPANWLRCAATWHQPSFEAAEFIEVTRPLRFAPGSGLPGRIWQSNQPAWIPNSTQDSGFVRAEQAGRAGLRAAVGVPVRLGDEVLGVLTLFSREAREPDGVLLELISAFGSQLGRFAARRQVEAAARAREEVYRAVAESAAEAVIVADDGGFICFNNHIASDAFGYAHEELPGRPFTALLPERYRDSYAERLRQPADGPTAPAAPVALHGLRKDGSEFPAEAVLTEWHGAGGRFVACTLRDVSASRLTEAALRVAEDRLRTVVTATPIILFALDSQGVVTLSEGKGLASLGLRPGQLVGTSVFDLYHDRPDILAECRRALAGEAFSNTVDVGGIVLDTTWTPLRDEGGNLIGTIGVAADNTDRWQAEAFRAGENKILELIATNAPLQHTLDTLVRLIEAQSDGMQASVVLLDDDGLHARHGAAPSLPEVYVRAIDGAAIGPRAGSCGTAMYLGQPVIVSDVLTDPRWADFHHLLTPHGLRACWSTPIFSSQGKVIGSFAMYYAQVRSPNQAELWLIEVATHIAGIAIDRKRAEVELHRRTEELHTVLNSVSDYLWSARVDTQGRLRYQYYSPVVEKITGRPPEFFMGGLEDWLSTIHPDDRPHMERVAARVISGEIDRQHEEYRIVLPDGSIRWVRDSATSVRLPGGEIRINGVVGDITERKRAEAARWQAEANYRHIFQNSVEGIYQSTVDGRVLTVNPAFAAVMGYDSPEDMIASISDLSHQLYVEPTRRDEFQRLIAEQGEVHGFEYEAYRKDGSRIWVLDNARMVRGPDNEVLHYEGFITDITARKRVEQELRRRNQELEAIAKVSGALRVAASRAEMLPVLLQEVCSLLEAEGAAVIMREPETDEVVVELGEGVWVPWTGLRLQPGEGVSGVVMASGALYCNDDVRTDARMTHRDLLADLGAVACIPLLAQGRAIGALWVGRHRRLAEADLRLLTAVSDIAATAIHRTTLHGQTERRLQHLTSLRMVDQAIAASLDLKVTFQVLLDQIVGQRGADAADILLLRPQLRLLEYAAGRGFRSPAIGSARLRLGEGFVGKAVLECRALKLPDLQNLGAGHERAALAAQEDFVSYYAVPLFAKGHVKGVLEVYHRTRLRADAEWMDYMETLAGQAAIAVDNLALFDELQHANLELAVAYDATIEGWSRALDLRDRETEGHTLRVTDITIRLARFLGVPEDTLVHVRRGALLHDIGKMGIPDAILLKPSALTEHEWTIMRQHPAYAYEMLRPIGYLNSALDIPYCHHERWDGAGYPRGLQGEQIPLVARIFAVADVWDALLSDRPYRQRWPKERVVQYIAAQAGTHFDPQVVEAFLKLQPMLDAGLN